MKVPDKRRVLDGLLESLANTLNQLTHAVEEIRQGAIHAEAKPENDKDTRALEQSYLARGQAIRAESLVDELQLLRSLSLPSLGIGAPIQAGALIALQEDDDVRWVFFAPHGGGITLHIDGIPVTVVTPVSALGRALLGRHVGEEIEVRVRNNVRAYSVTAVT